ncbi:MAG: hypothetical protein PHD76_01355 [Methylacidiphilales bacterium]|nr:hypothetical protein [Candidatus Methylacidiphilales bacterium]
MKKSFALISTLLLLAILTIMALAFMQSMRLNHLTARAYLYKARADLAAQGALDEARERIVRAASDPISSHVDRTFTTELEPAPDGFQGLSPLVTICRYSKTSGSEELHRACLPLVSTSVADASFKDNFANAWAGLYQAREDTATSDDLNKSGMIQCPDPVTGAPKPGYFRVELLDLKDGTGKALARYGYQVFDEQARLNPVFHHSKARKSTGGAAEEIALSLGNSVLLAPSELSRYKAAPALPASPYAIGQFLDSTERVDVIRHLFGYYTTPDEDVIPAGLPDAGKPKYNINELATNPVYGSTATERAEHIAAIIDRNLPYFKCRDPSLAGETDALKRRYLNRLAAGIVDYIDADTDITTVNGGEPAGRDLFPLVTCVAEQFYCGPETDADGFYHAVIQSRFFAQIWNPYTAAATGSARLVARNRMRIHYGTAIVTPLEDYEPAVQTNIIVRPNEFVVVAFPWVSQTFSSPTGPNISTASRPHWDYSPADTADQTTHLPFEFEWNGQRVDMNRRLPVSPGLANAGMDRNSKTLSYGVTHYQVCGIPTPSAPVGSDYRAVGDPRFTYLSNYDWSSLSASDTYANETRWKGRNRDLPPFTQNFASTWQQRDYVRANPAEGNAPGSINMAPDCVPSAYSEATDAANAPFYIRNGNMQSPGELGNIFDPAQADSTGAAPSGGKPPGIFVAGGGRTLRIGQPEFSYWDSPGRRAMELLDLFTANPINTGTGYSEMSGRININTAPREALEALFCGLRIESDGGLHGNVESKISKITADGALTLSSAIIAERGKNGAFRKLSDLYRILPVLNRADSYDPPLGNGPGKQAPLAMDRAREECFGKICNLVATQSRSYRIVATGQALDPAGRTCAQTFIEAIVSLRLASDSSGGINCKPEIIYERSY